MEENTQNPQPVEPVDQQPAATPEVTPPKKKGGLMKILIAVVALVVVGGGAGWYFMGMPGLETTQSPPSLEMGGSQFQGRSLEGKGMNAMEIQAEDVLNFEDAALVKTKYPLLDKPRAIYKKLDRGVQYLYSEKDLTVEEIVQNIKPVKGLNLLVTLNSPGGESLFINDPSKLTAAGYYMYPKGPYINTKEIKDPNNFKIPAGHVFAVIGSGAFEVNEKVLIDPTQTPSEDYLSMFAKEYKGWMLVPVNSEYSINAENLKWVHTLNDKNEFEYSSEIGENRMAWVYLPGEELLPPAVVDREEGVVVSEAGEIPYCSSALKLISPTEDNSLTITKDFDRETDVLRVKANGYVDGYNFKTSKGDHNIQFAGQDEASDHWPNINISGGPRSGSSVLITVTGYKQDGSTITMLDGCKVQLKIKGNQPEPPALVDPPALELEGLMPEIPSLIMDPEYNCGNNKREGTVEVCDGNDLLQKTCTTYKKGSIYTGGTLKCSNDCLYWDATQCTTEDSDALEPSVDPQGYADAALESAQIANKYVIETKRYFEQWPDSAEIKNSHIDVQKNSELAFTSASKAQTAVGEGYADAAKAEAADAAKYELRAKLGRDIAASKAEYLAGQAEQVAAICDTSRGLFKSAVNNIETPGAFTSCLCNRDEGYEGNPLYWNATDNAWSVDPNTKGIVPCLEATVDPIEPSGIDYSGVAGDYINAAGEYEESAVDYSGAAGDYSYNSGGYADTDLFN